jgi:lipopolysaccharide exporter
MRDAVSTLLAGSIAAHVLVYAARPVLTRVFTPEEFGILALFLAIASVLAIGASGKYEDAIMLAGDDREADQLLGVSLFLASLVSVGSLVVLMFTGEQVASLLDAPAIGPLAPWIAFAVFTISLLRILEMWLTRRRDFRGVARRRFLQSAVSAPGQIILGLAGAGVAGLVGGLIAGYVVAGASLVAGVAFHTRSREMPFSFDLPGVPAIMQRFRRFPAFSMPSAFVSALSVQLPAILLIYYFDPGVAGQFALAYGVLIGPAAMVGNAVAQAFFPEASRLRHDHRLAELVRQVGRRTAMAGLFPALAIMASGPALVAFVFGTEWREAGEFARYLAPWIFLNLIGSPLTRLFDVFERQNVELAIKVVAGAARAAALVAGGLLGDVHLAVFLFAIVSAIAWLVEIGLSVRLSGARFSALFSLRARDLAVTVVPVAIMVPGLIVGGDTAEVIGVAAASIVFAGLLLRTRGDAQGGKSQRTPVS